MQLLSGQNLSKNHSGSDLREDQMWPIFHQESILCWGDINQLSGIILNVLSVNTAHQCFIHSGNHKFPQGWYSCGASEEPREAARKGQPEPSHAMLAREGICGCCMGSCEWNIAAPARRSKGKGIPERFPTPRYQGESYVRNRVIDI